MLCDGNAMPLGRNGKALTILKYLLANRRRPVSQDHLMGWLWPESNLKKARWSLNSAIHGLRKLLGGCSSSLSTNYVTLEDGYYRLSPALRVTTDVDEFDERYEKGRRLEREGRMPAAAVEYERAIDLYRGDYLIEDLYDDWTMVERERLSNAYMDMLGRLAVHYMETGQYQESIRGCYRVLEKDRCHEDSYRLLMRCYARLGLRGRAHAPVQDVRADPRTGVRYLTLAGDQNFVREPPQGRKLTSTLRLRLRLSARLLRRLVSTLSPSGFACQQRFEPSALAFSFLVQAPLCCARGTAAHGGWARRSK